MEESISLKRFSAVSLLKIVAVGSSISVMAFSVLMGILAFFGAHTVHWNGKPAIGISALITSLVIGVILAVVITLMSWIGFLISFWIFSPFGRLTLEYIADEKQISTLPPT
jgi:hypothetical protein